MITYKCKNCGGEMTVSAEGSLYCEYCGSKAFFNDADIRLYKQFRLEFLNHLYALHQTTTSEEADESLLWQRAEHIWLDNKTDVYYLYTTNYDGVTIYLTRNSVLYRFKKNQIAKEEQMTAMLSKLNYPSADVRTLQNSFPKIIGIYPLEDESLLVALQRDENFYPLAMVGALEPQHAAWVVSRLENICCVLEYSGLLQNDINLQSVFMNPFTHQACLFGAWWKATALCNKNTDLKALRTTAEQCMGIYAQRAPALFKKFIKDPPENNAFDDFQLWDKVIESKDGFGGRRFAKLKINI